MQQKKSLSEVYNILFKGKSESSFVQFFRYLFVGGFSALADIGTLFFVASILHIYYLIAAAIAFLVGNVVNYFLSVAWVFRSSGQRKKELTLFTVIGLGGLVLNELIIWIGVEFIGLHYLLAKILAVSLILVYSFNLRRIMLKKLREKTVRNDSARKV